jgi:hypothetical protein
VLFDYLRSIAVQTTHRNAKERTASKERGIARRETGSQFENNEKNVVHDEWPLASPSIGSNTYQVCN